MIANATRAARASAVWDPDAEAIEVSLTMGVSDWKCPPKYDGLVVVPGRPDLLVRLATEVNYGNEEYHGPGETDFDDVFLRLDVSLTCLDGVGIPSCLFAAIGPVGREARVTTYLDDRGCRHAVTISVARCFNPSINLRLAPA